MSPRSLYLIAFIFSGSCLAQKDNFELTSSALGRRIINKNDTLYVFFVRKPDSPIKTNNDRFYHWFKNDTILVTAGSYDGWLLNGPYKVFYPDKNLKEAGSFHDGLPDGEWKSWHPNGTLQSVYHWKNGKSVIPKRD